MKKVYFNTSNTLLYTRILQLGRFPYGEAALILFTLTSHGSFIADAEVRIHKMDVGLFDSAHFTTHYIISYIDMESCSMVQNGTNFRSVEIIRYAQIAISSSPHSMMTL